MQAFHNDLGVKAKYLARVEAHRLADEIVQGVGFEKNGKVRACAVGCTLDVYDPTRYPIELGLPQWLARLEDAIHEGVSLVRAKKWPGQFLKAIPVGADVEPVQWQLTILRMERLLPSLIANTEPYARECEAALRGVITMAQGFLKDGVSVAAESAESAAWSAARSAAWSAERSAESIAWSAERSAESAERSIAWTGASIAWSAERSAESAAWSTARSAAWSAESAAWSAESAAWSAAWSAARSAESTARSAESTAWSAERTGAYEWEANTLLKLLRECKAANV